MGIYEIHSVTTTHIPSRTVKHYILITRKSLYYKDRKCTENKNSPLRIIASLHYNAKDLIVKVVPQAGYC